MGLQQLWLYYSQLFILFFPLFLCQITCLHAQLFSQEQSSALLQLKGTFSFNKSASFENCDYNGGITSFPKMESWKRGSDCCSWDGVDCDNKTGRVIGLDLSCSWLQGTFPPNNSLFLSFYNLQKLNLAFNDFSMSRIPHEFTRFTELTHLNLSVSRFWGEVPRGVSFLNKLVSLDLSHNHDLRFEEGGFELLIQNLSKIRYLDLSNVNMSSSMVPNSLLNLTSLKTLELEHCGIHGKFPSGVFHLPYLLSLSLWDNDGLTGYIPDFMNMSHPLQSLSLSGTGFSGELPDSVGNLKSLERLGLLGCEFHGSIPTSLWNLTQISILGLSSNNFRGTLPSSLPYHRDIWELFLSDNDFTGPFFSLDAIANLTELVVIDVSNNRLSGPLPSQVIALPNFVYLNISGNLINDTIPPWVFELPALRWLDLSYNKLIGQTLEFQSAALKIVDLSHNDLIGTVPKSYFKLQNLTYLVLSSNHFSGPILETINLSTSIIVLELQNNSFSGTICDSFGRENSLETMNLNNNGFEGPVPKSLVHCSALKVLDLGNNKFCDKFPHWLGYLPKLHILILRSNRFHGPIRTSKNKLPFPSLRVIDLSHNNFTGPLPEEYFRNFNAMANVDERNLGLQYMLANRYPSAGYYFYSISMTVKGSFLGMEKVLTYFIAIDFSNNQFEGMIPDIIGMLNSVRGLNLSHNRLTGQIPTSLGNLTKLESLDLSSNRLIGEIPRHLVNLIWLQVLDLSHNQLRGRIPTGKQFDTFPNASYIHNLALCGPPMSASCSDSGPPEPPPSKFQQEEDSQLASGLDWEVILPGYGFGLVFGLVMGYLMFTFRRPRRFVKLIEGIGNRRGKRVRRSTPRHQGRRN